MNKRDYGVESSQRELVKQALLNGEHITPLEGLRDYGTLRLGARIYELRKGGMGISKDMVKTPSGQWVASYYADPTYNGEDNRKHPKG